MKCPICECFECMHTFQEMYQHMKAQEQTQEPERKDDWEIRKHCPIHSGLPIIGYSDYKCVCDEKPAKNSVSGLGVNRAKSKTAKKGS